MEAFWNFPVLEGSVLVPACFHTNLCLRPFLDLGCMLVANFVWKFDDFVVAQSYLLKLNEVVAENSHQVFLNDSAACSVDLDGNRRFLKIRALMHYPS